MRASRGPALRCVALCLCLGATAAVAARAAPAGAPLLAAGLTPSSSDVVPPPVFCHGLACPEFAVLSSTKAYELRRYAPSSWVSTVVTGADYDAAVNQARPPARAPSKAPRAHGPALRRASIACSPISAAPTTRAPRSP